MTTRKAIGKVVALSASMHQANRKAKAAGRDHIFYPHTEPLVVLSPNNEDHCNTAMVVAMKKMHGDTKVSINKCAVEQIDVALKWEVPVVLYNLNKSTGDLKLYLPTFITRLLGITGMYAEYGEPHIQRPYVDETKMAFKISDVKVYLKSPELVEYITGILTPVGPYADAAKEIVKTTQCQFKPRFVQQPNGMHPLLVTWDLVPGVNPL